MSSFRNLVDYTHWVLSFFWPDLQTFFFKSFLSQIKTSDIYIFISDSATKMLITSRLMVEITSYFDLLICYLFYKSFYNHFYIKLAFAFNYYLFYYLLIKLVDYLSRGDSSKNLLYTKRRISIITYRIST